MVDFFAGGRVGKRAAFFSGMARQMNAFIPELAEETHFLPDAPVTLAHCYFLLSDDYKSARNKPGSRTDDFKKAALTAVAVMVVRPFSPLAPENVTTIEAYLANATFALACGNAWAANRNLFEHYPFDYLKRFYVTLDNVRIEALAEFKSHLLDGLSIRDIQSVSLTNRDQSVLDDWVLKFYMLCEQLR